jgi:hypothetical protein
MNAHSAQLKKQKKKQYRTGKKKKLRAQSRNNVGKPTVFYQPKSIALACRNQLSM